MNPAEDGLVFQIVPAVYQGGVSTLVADLTAYQQLKCVINQVRETP